MKPLTLTLLTFITITAIDGDTFRIGHRQIRLACIDAPEKTQPLGTVARERLKTLLGEQPRIITIDRDRYGREIAKVYNGSTFINEKMVSEGLAYVYHRFINHCTKERQRLIEKERQARSQRKGVWNGRHTPPWEYRRSRNRR